MDTRNTDCLSTFHNKLNTLYSIIHDLIEPYPPQQASVSSFYTDGDKTTVYKSAFCLAYDLENICQKMVRPQVVDLAIVRCIRPKWNQK